MKNNIIHLADILYPNLYKTSYILAYHTLNEELEDLIGQSGYVKKFQIKFHKALRFLEQLKRNCIMNPKLFEELKGSDGLFAITLHGSKNIRILFTFEYIYGQEKIILLYCFQEKSTKDYQEAIIEAKKRLNI